MARLTIAFLIAIGMLQSGCAPDPAPDAQVENRGSGTENWWDALPRPEWGKYERVPVNEDWFEVYRIIDGVFAIYEPAQFEEVISFLITGDDIALLFDTGLGIGDMRSVVDQLTDLKVTVLNSHTHYDHIGGNHQYETIYAMDTEFTRGRVNGLPHERVNSAAGVGQI